MVMLGSLGSVTATVPVEHLLAWMGWRQLFEVLAAATGATAILIYAVVPERGVAPSAARATLGSVLGDRRFWRMAPLSATCVGSAWSLQGLWASPWFTDVEGLDRASLVRQLFMMSIVLSAGAWLFGTTVHSIKRRGIGAEAVLAMVAVLFIAAELSLILRASLPSILPWSIVAIVGTATVVSFAVIADYFPPELAGRANGALKRLALRLGISGAIRDRTYSEQWSANDGHRPVQAYQVAFGLNVVLQIATLVWFALPWRRSIASWMSSILFFRPADVSCAVEPVGLYEDSVILLSADDDADW